MSARSQRDFDGSAVVTGALPRPLASVARECEVKAARQEPSAILALVDDLAVLAADLWFEGKLEKFPVHEEPLDADDE